MARVGGQWRTKMNSRVNFNCLRRSAERSPMADWDFSQTVPLRTLYLPSKLLTSPSNPTENQSLHLVLVIVTVLVTPTRVAVPAVVATPPARARRAGADDTRLDPSLLHVHVHDRGLLHLPRGGKIESQVALKRVSPGPRKSSLAIRVLRRR